MPLLSELRLERGSTLASFRDLGSSLSNLRVLWLSACGIRHLDGVGALSSLEELYLAFNDVEDLTSIALHDRLEVKKRAVFFAEPSAELAHSVRLPACWMFGRLAFRIPFQNDCWVLEGHASSACALLRGAGGGTIELDVFHARRQEILGGKPDASRDDSGLRCRCWISSPTTSETRSRQSSWVLAHASGRSPWPLTRCVEKDGTGG